MQNHCIVPRQKTSHAQTNPIVPSSVYSVLHSCGQPLDTITRKFFEPRFGQDFSSVRVYTDEKAAESARQVNALAYTVGPNIVFNMGQYAPGTTAGKKLLAHELTHVRQQSPSLRAIPLIQTISKLDDSLELEADQVSKNILAKPDQATDSGPKNNGYPPLSVTATRVQLQREPTYPDTTCGNVQDSITRAWPTAKAWVQVARASLANPDSVASFLQTHFKLDPSDSTQSADLSTIRSNFARMESLFDTPIDNRCNTPNIGGGRCQLPDGRKYAAYVHSGRPEDGIWHCLPSADVSFLNQAPLIDTLVHEVAHLADSASTDYAYRTEAAVTTYERMTRQQAIHNGDSYSEFAKDQFSGPSQLPLELGISTGVLLSSGRPRWVIRASYDIRSRSGIEVFDLIGGLHGFLALDPTARTGEPLVRDVGGEINVGVISRSAQTHFFADTRLGAFLSADMADPRAQTRTGLSISLLIGWANSGFRAGINLNALCDFLGNNHGVIIGGEFSWGP